MTMSTKEDSFDYPKNVRFHCTKCALCCGDTSARTRHIIMTEAEAEGISRKNHVTVKDFARKIDGKTPYVFEMRKNQGGKCVFLDGEICTIYSFRPLVCQFYPFELKSDATDRYFFSCTDECPGIGEGKVLTRKKFMTLFSEAKKRFGRSLGSDLMYST